MIRTRRKRNRTSRSSRFGTSALEFSLTAPALLIVIFCSCEFARISMMRNIAQNAAYEAARVSIVEGATNAEGVAEAERILARIGAQGATISINSGQEFDTDTDAIVARIEIPMEQNAFFFPMFYEDKTIVAESSMRTERYNGFYDSNLN